MLAGCLALLAGAAMTLAAIETASAAAFLAGTAVAGAGSGTGFFLGAYRILTPLAGSGQRASLIAAIWIVFYLAFSVPVVIAGAAITHFGLHRTAVVYSAALTGAGRGGRGQLPVPQAPPGPGSTGSAGQPASRRRRHARTVTDDRDERDVGGRSPQREAERDRSRLAPRRPSGEAGGSPDLSLVGKKEHVMKAIAIDDFGAPPSLHDLPVPEPGEGEVLVRVRASSVNGFDVAVAGGT